MGVTARLRRSYYHRQIFMVVILGSMGLFLCWQGVRRRMPLMVGFGLGPVALWGALAVREYRRGVLVADTKGVTRRDGRRFLWEDLQEKREVRGRLPGGDLGPLNHVEFRFPDGKVRVFPFVLENPGEVLAFMEKPVCGTCGPLGDYHHGAQKGGREAEDTFLPAEAWKLATVKETEPGRNRSPVLKRCPECGSYFLYEVAYEFLVYGSEDDQYLTRLSEEEAAKYLQSPA